jgi:4-hydroxy-2-oxoheptanedioate aldolase
MRGDRNEPGERRVLIADLVRNNVKEKLARDEVVAAMTVRLVRSGEIARIAQTAGFDTLYVDMEHASFSLETCAQICVAALAAGIAPFVRVPANTSDYISRVLDAGALGIIAPHIHCAEQARAVVRAAKYPPMGERSNAGSLPHLHYRSFPVLEIYSALNDATMVIVQFESAAALAAAHEIVAVDGVDMVLIGLNDLRADWGIPGEYDHPRVREAYAETIAVCRNRGKHCAVGGLASRPDLAAEFVKMGARYVSTGTDLGFLLAACTAKARQVHEIGR